MKLGSRFKDTSGLEVDAHPAHPIITHAIQFHFMARVHKAAQGEEAFLEAAWHLY